MLGLAGAAYGLIQRGKRKDSEQQLESYQNALNINQERKDLLQEGLAAGRAKAQRMTGQSEADVGANVSDIVSRRKEMLDAPSRAESQMLAKGQQTARRARSAGASDAQQRQIELESGQAAGMQADIDRERRLQDFQSLMSGIMSTQSALEPGYGQLYLASQHIAPEKPDKGLLGNLFDGLGL